MFVTPDGERILIVDGHTHLWDGRPSNWRNDYGRTFIDTFWGGHVGFTPADKRWTQEQFRYYGAEKAARDLFVDGYCDAAIMLPVDLRDFYKDGFNTTAQCSELKALCPERVVLNGRIDPREGSRGLAQLEKDHDRFGFRGVKLYTGEWNGTSRGYRLTDEFVRPYLEKCRELGIGIVHVHKGPTTHPLDYDAFDVRDVDNVATSFPDLKFVVDHCGMPRIDDFCAVAGQEPNVYGGLALVTSFIRARPRHFKSMLIELLWGVGPDRLIFGSDYAITSPDWIIEAFMAFELDEADTTEAGHVLDLDAKRKILGLNAAKLYGLDVDGLMNLPPVDLAAAEASRHAAE